MSPKRSDEQTQDLDKHSTLKVIISVLVLIACWAVVLIGKKLDHYPSVVHCRLLGCRIPGF